MKPIEIRIEILKRKPTISQRQIAFSLNPPVSPQAVQQVIDKKFISIRIMKAIAAAIECDEKEVFPEYFLKDSVCKKAS
jgi:lambda repressor-like predicted transcriptional regulator